MDRHSCVFRNLSVCVFAFLSVCLWLCFCLFVFVFLSVCLCGQMDSNWGVL